ncbi:alpha-1,2-mannosyltransferase [Aspergillus luchuensis]|uniref:Alpha-1,2-mannosyltransferase n=1 Tax=Aspergillus kawachii TaxID=1069201 RepID=A0A146FTC0_ASPKA|nr:alpha-1,2-mannosyltransferase [Aspergillus luchuensis]
MEIDEAEVWELPPPARPNRTSPFGVSTVKLGVHLPLTCLQSFTGIWNVIGTEISCNGITTEFAPRLSCARDQGCIGNATSTEELHSQELNQVPDVRIDYHSSFMSHMKMRMVLRMVFSDWLEAAARKHPDGLPAGQRRTA